MSKHHNPDPKSGFTLIEILVSVSLLVIIGISSFYIFKNSANFLIESRQKLKAAHVIQTIMEELRSLSYSELLLQNGKSFAKGRGTIKIVPVDSNLAEVQAKFKWDPQKKDIQIYTLRSK